MYDSEKFKGKKTNDRRQCRDIEGTFQQPCPIYPAGQVENAGPPKTIWHGIVIAKAEHSSFRNEYRLALLFPYLSDVINTINELGIPFFHFPYFLLLRFPFQFSFFF